MAQLTVQNILPTGIIPTFNVTAVAGDSFLNNGKTFLHVKNASATAVNVTVDSKALSNYGTDVDIIISIPATGEKVLGPFEVGRFNNNFGIANVTYSAVTSVTVSVISF